MHIETTEVNEGVITYCAKERKLSDKHRHNWKLGGLRKAHQIENKLAGNIMRMKINKLVLHMHFVEIHFTLKELPRF